MVKVLLSLRTSKAVVMAARGPEVKKSTASCGTYVKLDLKSAFAVDMGLPVAYAHRNISVVTPTPRVRVGARRESSGL